jgi:hypothetical protein
LLPGRQLTLAAMPRSAVSISEIISV